MRFPKKLIRLYQTMADHTAPVCANADGKGCLAPHSCCSGLYCEMALDRAREAGVELPRTAHPELPLMGPTGCTAPPHLRPICTVHVCSIASLGFKPNDPRWTARYFRLRNAINKLEQSLDFDDL